MKNMRDTGHKFGKLLESKNALRRDLIIKIVEKRLNPPIYCSAGSLAGVIFNNGDVRPCETLPFSFGNIRDYNYNLQSIWSSNSARSIRNNIISNKCICTHECFLSVNILTNPSLWPKLFKYRIRK